MLPLQLNAEQSTKVSDFCVKTLGQELDGEKFFSRVTKFGKSVHYRFNLDWVSISGQLEMQVAKEVTDSDVLMSIIDLDIIRSLAVIRRTGMDRFNGQNEMGRFEFIIDYFKRF